MSVNPCPGGTIYTIRAGDTFYALAARFNITLSSLIAANPGVNPGNLQIGQQICIPGVTPPSPAPCPGTSYTIQAGDTFFRLAQKFGISVASIIAVNPGINPNALFIGQRICIPPVPGAARVCALRLRGEENAPNAGGVFWIRQEAGASMYFVTAVNLPDPATFGESSYIATLGWGRTTTDLPLTPIEGVPGAWFGLNATGPTFPQEFFTNGSVDLFPGPVLGALMQGCG